MNQLPLISSMIHLECSLSACCSICLSMEPVFVVSQDDSVTGPHSCPGSFCILLPAQPQNSPAFMSHFSCFYLFSAPGGTVLCWKWSISAARRTHQTRAKHQMKGANERQKRKLLALEWLAHLQMGLALAGPQGARNLAPGL